MQSSKERFAAVRTASEVGGVYERCVQRRSGYMIFVCIRDASPR